MVIDLVVPEVGESIHEVQVLKWKKQEGDWVDKDEEVVEVETEKATVPVSAPAAGRLSEILKRDAEFAEVGDALGRLATGDEAAADGAKRAPAPAQAQPAAGDGETAERAPAPKPAAAKKQEKPRPQPAAAETRHPETRQRETKKAPAEKPVRTPEPPPEPAPAQARKAPSPPADAQAPKRTTAPRGDGRQEERVPMSMLRRTIARRLVEAQRNAALVTTFNEIDMQEVMELRRSFGDSFREAHDVKLGFMSFFVKAVVDGLKQCPEVNAEVQGDDIVYRNYYDIGVAIGSGKGLVVPILRSCERLSFAQIERQIAQLVEKVAAGRLAPEDLEGGTFTISNGGIYGSLLSTPIVNPPQSGVLGLHAIQDRPVAKNGQVAIRPMMYVALTYDHRIVDGREAVGFLRRIKEVIETPSRLLLEI